MAARAMTWLAPLVLVGLAVGQTTNPERAFRAERVLTGTGESLPGGVLVVSGDGSKLSAVGSPDKTGVGVSARDFGAAVICPGFVDAGSYAGIWRHRNHGGAALNPHLHVADSFDPSDGVLDSLRRSGVTTFHVTPGDADVVGGVSGVVRGSRRGTSWLRRGAFMKISLHADSWTSGRPPTSLLGGIEMLLGCVDDPTYTAFGRENFVVSARTPSELRTALDLSGKLGMAPIIRTDAGILDVLQPDDRPRGIIFDPLLPNLDDRWRGAPLMLSQRKIPFAFASDAPSRPPEVLRLSAIVAQEGGLSAEAALRSLTLDAARILGVDERVGSLEVGKAADFCVWSHHPMDPRARLLHVIQGGEVVFSTEEQPGGQR